MKQEREYKEALDTFNEKNREKVQLITKLMEVSFEFSVLIFTELLGQQQNRVLFEHSLTGVGLFFSKFLPGEMGQLVGESEKLRLKKLEELSKSIETE